MDAHPAASIFPLMSEQEYAGLLEDIRANGLREPIIVDSKTKTILDGRNRYRACRESETVPEFEWYDGDDPTGYVVSLNLHRRHLSESQRAMIANRIANAGHGGDRRSDQAAKLPLVTQERASALLNVSPRLVRAARVVEQHGTPELIAAVDAGKVAVSAAVRELQRNETAKLAREAAAPTGRYRCIVLDPPWEGADTGDENPIGRGDPAYATMRLPEIAALPVPDLMETDDCHVYLWATNRVLPLAFTLLDTWGIRYITMLTWCKPSIGVGRYYRNNTEHVLFGMTGTRLLARSDVGTWFTADRQGRHSTKPVEFYSMVEACSPGPRLEMFARAPREGWTVWGGEAGV